MYSCLDLPRCKFSHNVCDYIFVCLFEVLNVNVNEISMEIDKMLNTVLSLKKKANSYAIYIFTEMWCS